MLPLPQRHSLVMQTREAVREGIAAGLWKNLLPGERELSRRLQVSRPTLRTALKLLEREGLLAVGQNKRTVIGKTRALKPRSRKDSVAFVTKMPLNAISRNRIFLIDYMQRALHEQGLRLEIVAHPDFGTNHPSRAIKHLGERGDFKAFILLMSSRAVQEWFCERSLPAISLGSVYDGIPMPSIDTDYRSMGHHAAGVFLRHGHRRAAWIIPEANHAGDLETEQSFIETFRGSGNKTVTCRIIRHGESSADLIQKLTSVLRAKDRPTAFFVVNRLATTAIVTELYSRGLRIPRDVSLISRDYDQSLEWIRPSIAHYVPPVRRIASGICRLVSEVADSGGVRQQHIRIIPEFCKAESIAAADR